MLFPYQGLLRCGDILFAAAGPRIDSFNIIDGSHLSFWECPTSSSQSIISPSSTLENRLSVVEVDPSVVCHRIPEPPMKKRRLSDPADGPETAESAARPSKKTGSKHVQTSGYKEFLIPTITSLVATETGQHVITVGGADKTIRVLKHDGKGVLKQLSTRIMPKKPCAIALTLDQTIIIADKFGDVYSLPLIIDQITTSKLKESIGSHDFPTLEEPKPFVSAANHLTVHSARNRRALKNQMRQMHKIVDRSDLGFEHELILGHASMLTDMILVENLGRSYIVTADRDEHVRISRGVPQAHVIEGYCLGHSEFISRLCFPTTFSDLLVSGGGDDELYVWKWLSGELLHKANLRRYIEAVVSENAKVVGWDAVADSSYKQSEPQKIAVSCLRHVEVKKGIASDFIVVACEGIPAIIFMFLRGDGILEYFQTVRLDGNVLDIVTSSLGVVLVSIDWIHEAGSTSKIRRAGTISGMTKSLRCFSFQETEWIERVSTFSPPRCLTDSSVSTGDDLKQLSKILYGVESLRKRGGED